MAEGKRSRAFWFLVYPEGMSEDFVDVLNASGGKGFYILHDMDKLEDGAAKKAHYHVLIIFENAHSLNSVKKIGVRCGAANGVIEAVNNSVACARYLCHMDSPLKHRYNVCEVKCFGGADYQAFCETSGDRRKARLEVVREMIEYICENHIYSYSDLIEYCCNYRNEWLEKLLTYPTVGKVILEYMKSKNWTDRNIEKNCSSCHFNTRKVKLDF